MSRSIAAVLFCLRVAQRLDVRADDPQFLIRVALRGGVLQHVFSLLGP